MSKKPRAAFRPSVKETSPEVAAKLLGEEPVEPAKLQVTRSLKRSKGEKSKLSTVVRGPRKPRVPHQLSDGSEKLQLTFHLSPSIHRRLRLQSVEEDLPMSYIVERLLSDGLKKG